jgi:hypothetical protein
VSKQWRPKSHFIGQKAQGVFESLLPMDCAASRQESDYAIDYRIEVFNKGQKTGYLFGVQLKGSEALDDANPNWRFALKTKHVKAFLKERQPVFLVLVNVLTKTGRWVFVQGFEQSVLSVKKWRKQKKVTFHLPISNNLSDAKLFEAALSQAFELVLQSLPGGIKPSIEHEQMRMAAIDPRFEVKVTATDSSTHYQLFAKEEVELKISFELKSKAERLQNLLEQGLPASFDAGEFNIEGSPLFDDAQNGQLSITPQALNGVVNASKRRADGADELLLSMPAIVHAGKSGGLLLADIQNAPFRLEVRLQMDWVTPNRAKFHAPLKRWFGQQLTQLAYFDGIARFVRASQEDSTLAVGFSVPGETSFGLLVPFTQLRGLRIYSVAIDALERARWIARELGISQTLESDHFDHEWNDVFELFDLLKANGIAKLNPHQEISVTLPREEAQKFLDFAVTHREGEQFRHVATWDYWFFGKTIRIPALAHEMSRMRLNAKDAQTQMDDLSNVEIRVTFKGDESSEQTCRFDRQLISVQ